MSKSSYLKGFMRGLGYHTGKRYAQDAAQWITAKPNGENGKGTHILIDSETKQVLGGLGGKFTGKHISEVRRTAPKPSKSNANGSRIDAKGSSNTNSHGKLDLTLPERLEQGTIIQNRNRASIASQAQINSIAANPDYYRLSASRDLANGAPVISYGKYNDAQFGKTEKAVDAEGKRYDVQYAVVEASDVLTSHNRYGQENADYYSDDPSKKRAIAGNGRLTALQSAYERGTAEEYKKELLADDSHGIDPKVIEGMKNPVLVRVMQPKDVTQDIGDKTNIQTTSTMTATETARNDANRLSFRDFETDEDGEPTDDSLQAFIGNMPQSERNELLDVDGTPTQQAVNRMKAAAFAKAYQNDDLIRSYTQRKKKEARNLMRGLEIASVSMAKLEEAKDGYDIRGLVSKAAGDYIKAVNAGQNPSLTTGQIDMFADPKADAVNRELLKIFVDNRRSGVALGEKLKTLADNLYKESQKEKVDMFGMPARQENIDIIKQVAAQDGKPKSMSARALQLWRTQGAPVIRTLATDNKENRAFFKALRG